MPRPLALLLALLPALATASDVTEVITSGPSAQRLGLSAAAGYLGSPGGSGAALSTGLHLSLGRHFALGLDLGYGLLDAGASKQDRWWVIPTAAFVLPLGPVRLDLGAGIGFGASSGYPSWSAYAAGPFMPVWAFQLVPAVRAHVQATMTLSPNVDLFGRAELGSLIVGGNSLGFRAGNAGAGLTDTLWLNLSLGFQFRLL